MKPDITYEQARQLDAPVFVDVRSPGEFDTDHIPDAFNLPILDDEQRKIVGTLYKKEGREAASRKGVELVAPDIADTVERLRELSARGPLVLYCWRGGLRSQSMRDIAHAAGIEAYRLQGGYKAYRHHVISTLDGIGLPLFYSLYGLTGCGKTEILSELAGRGMQVLDLEGLANHRGSVFGAVGLGAQPSQKRFESRLVERLGEMDETRPVLIEGESRRIGRLFIPERIFEHLLASRRILVYDTVESRADRIIREYGVGQTLPELIQAIRHLGRRIGKDNVERFIALLERGDYRTVVRELLVRYYDPLYRHPSRPSDEYFRSVCSTEIGQAADRIQQILSEGE